MFSKHFRIGNRWIGEDEPCFIVAEIGLNHNGDVELAKKLIEEAKNCGADAVKFQKRDLNELFTEKGMNQKYYKYHSYGETYGEHKKTLELSEDDYWELKRHARKMGIIFFASAWDKKSADFLESLDVPAFKIASADVTNIPLITHIAQKQKPVVMSTGMSTLQEVKMAVKVLAEHCKDVVLLHCVSTYPSEYDEINLKVIGTLKRKFDCLVGYSGHNTGVCLAIAAPLLGACMVEKHFTLNRAFKGPDHAASLEPPGLRLLVRDIRDVEKSLGDGKKRIMPREVPIRKKLGKSIVAMRTIKKGELVEFSMLSIKSPALGLKPQHIPELIGKVATREIHKDEYLTLKDFK